MSRSLMDTNLVATTVTLRPGAKTDVPVAGPGYVQSIVTLYLAGDKFTGTQFDFTTSSVHRFAFDTHTQSFQSAPEGPLSWEVANDRAQLRKESYWKISAEYRHHWPNYILLILIVSGEGAIGLWARRAWITKPSPLSRLPFPNGPSVVRTPAGIAPLALAGLAPSIRSSNLPKGSLVSY